MVNKLYEKSYLTEHNNYSAMLFIAGGTGVDKSFLTKIFFQSLAKTFSYRNSSLDKPKILLLAPTGNAAVMDMEHIPVGYF